MALGNEPHPRAVGCQWASPARSGLLGFVVQAVGALVIWVLVDDRAGPSWSNTDLREWLTFGLALAVVLAALGGAVTRRWQVASAVVVGCLLALALGMAFFAGYAVVNSA